MGEGFLRRHTAMRCHLMRACHATTHGIHACNHVPFYEFLPSISMNFCCYMSDMGGLITCCEIWVAKFADLMSCNTVLNSSCPGITTMAQLVWLWSRIWYITLKFWQTMQLSHGKQRSGTGWLLQRQGLLHMRWWLASGNPPRMIPSWIANPDLVWRSTSRPVMLNAAMVMIPACSIVCRTTCTSWKATLVWMIQAQIWTVGCKVCCPWHMQKFNSIWIRFKCASSRCKKTTYNINRLEFDSTVIGISLRILLRGLMWIYIEILFGFNWQE